jgi:large subunit ribosomal protein L37Ae
MAKSSIRYGASLRKRNNEIKREKRALYKCEACGRIAVKRIGTSIWRCKHCNATYAGGAYSMSTPAGETAKRLISETSMKQ